MGESLKDLLDRANRWLTRAERNRIIVQARQEGHSIWHTSEFARCSYSTVKRVWREHKRWNGGGPSAFATVASADATKPRADSDLPSDTVSGRSPGHTPPSADPASATPADGQVPPGSPPETSAAPSQTVSQIFPDPEKVGPEAA